MKNLDAVLTGLLVVGIWMYYNKRQTDIRNKYISQIAQMNLRSAGAKL